MNIPIVELPAGVQGFACLSFLLGTCGGRVFILSLLNIYSLSPPHPLQLQPPGALLSLHGGGWQLSHEWPKDGPEGVCPSWDNPPGTQD